MLPSIPRSFKTFLLVCLHVHLSLCPSVSLSICQFVRLSICPLVCLSTCPSNFFWRWSYDLVIYPSIFCFSHTFRSFRSTVVSLYFIPVFDRHDQAKWRRWFWRCHFQGKYHEINHHDQLGLREMIWSNVKSTGIDVRSIGNKAIRQYAIGKNIKELKWGHVWKKNKNKIHTLKGILNTIVKQKRDLTTCRFSHLHILTWAVIET